MPIDDFFKKEKVLQHAKKLGFNEFQGSDERLRRYKERYSTYYTSVTHYFKFCWSILIYFLSPVNIGLLGRCIRTPLLKFTGFPVIVILQELNLSTLGK